MEERTDAQRTGMSTEPYNSSKRVNSSESPVACKKRRIALEEPSTSNNLCQRCVDLNINDPDTLPGPPDQYLGDVKSITTHASCPFCCLLTSVHVAHNTGTARYLRNIRYHLHAFKARHVFKAGNPATCGSKQVGIILGVCRASPNQPWSTELQRCLARGLIAPLPRRFTPPHQFQVQKVCPREADLSQILEWLRICLAKHSDTCTMSRRDPQSRLDCIDIDNCDTMRPTPIGPDEKYLAFSYVCAEAEDVVLQETVQRVPQSVQDAMAVTRALGFRYIWIDRYCINQEDNKEKQAAIAQMDSIYEAATMTIIAAPAPGSPPGLPGISRERRVLAQPIAKMGKQTWTSTLPHLSAAISSSAWKARGWTYQEAVLSTRCLFFTDVQVYFLCQCATACESLTILPDADLLSLGASTFRSYPFDTDLANRRPRRQGLSHFFQDLCNYKSRGLTYDNDSLNAFQGILERSNFRNVFGIPIVQRDQDISVLNNSDLALSFARGLWWENPGHPSYDPLPKNHPHASFRRILQFPSWSWCGWSGPLTSHKFWGDVDSDDGCNPVDETTAAIKIYLETESGSLKNPKQIMMDPTLSLSQTLRIGTIVHLVRIRLPTAVHGLPYLCECSADNKTCKVPHSKVHYVRVFQDPFVADGPFEDFFTRKWHVIRLFTVKRCMDTPEPVFAVFVVDWSGDREHSAQVVGSAYLDHNALDEGAREIIKLR